MSAEEYAVMAGIETDFWWYRGLNELVGALLGREADRLGRTLSVLDAGCGTGGLLQSIAKDGRLAVYGFDLAADALPFLVEKAPGRVLQASALDCPVRDASLDAVVSLDVLGVIGAPGDAAALKDFARVLKPGGALLLNLPAYPWLASSHDAAVSNRRRYTVAALGPMLEQAGLLPEILTPRNALLFPPAALVRLVKKFLGDRSKSDLVMPHPLVNRAFLALLRLENRFFQAGGRAPFGLSVFTLARKPQTSL